ncbi:hypothetical protein Tco_0351163 [Tanacetum coccineum]
MVNQRKSFEKFEIGLVRWWTFVDNTFEFVVVGFRALDRQYLAIQSFEQEALLLKKHYDEYKDDADSSSATKKQRTSSSRNDGHDRLAVEHPTYEDDTVLGKFKNDDGRDFREANSKLSLTR